MASHCVANLHREESGATAVEYAIMAAAIAAVVAAIVIVVGLQTETLFDSVVQAWS